MPYLVLGVMAHTRTSPSSHRRLFKELGGLSAGMVIPEALRPAYPGTSWDPDLRVVVALIRSDGTYSDDVRTLRWPSPGKGLFGELDLGDKAEEVRKLLAATAQIIKLQRNQIRLLCELAGVVVNSAAGPNGLPIPKKKSNKEDTDECEAAD